MGDRLSTRILEWQVVGSPRDIDDVLDADRRRRGACRVRMAARPAPASAACAAAAIAPSASSRMKALSCRLDAAAMRSSKRLRSPPRAKGGARRNRRPAHAPGGSAAPHPCCRHRDSPHRRSQADAPGRIGGHGSTCRFGGIGKAAVTLARARSAAAAITSSRHGPATPDRARRRAPWHLQLCARPSCSLRSACPSIRREPKASQHGVCGNPGRAARQLAGCRGRSHWPWLSCCLRRDKMGGGDPGWGERPPPSVRCRQPAEAPVAVEPQARQAGGIFALDFPPRMPWPN